MIKPAFISKISPDASHNQLFYKQQQFFFIRFVENKTSSQSLSLIIPKFLSG